MTRILAIATNPETAASTRFRVTQWRPYLERAGFSLTLDSFFSPRGAEVLYRPGRRVAKLAYLMAGSLRRAAHLVRAARTADVLFVHREAFPLGRRVLFDRLRTFRGPIVYDYDDAMFLPQRGGRGILARLEDLDTPAAVMRLSALVLAGNPFLADYARGHATNVRHLPTSIDTERFRPRPQGGAPARCVVSWIGSHTTAKYVRAILPVLEKVHRRHPFTLRLVGVPTPVHAPGLDVVQTPWALEREIDDFAGADIGIYPLAADQWTAGKCGFKAIQFMACGVPVVAEGVGVNREIVQDGDNSFLATSETEWVDKLTLLLSDPKLREKLGQAGRVTIEERYSLKAQAPGLVAALREIVEGGPHVRHRGPR